MAQQKTIAIDIDDVIADGTESIRRLVNARFGVDLKEEHYRVKGPYKGYYQRVWQEHGIAELVDFGRLYDEMIVDQSHVPVLAGAHDAIHALMQKYHIVFVTSRDIKWKEATHRWFRDFLGLGDIKVHFVGNYYSGITHDKGELSRALGATLLIDDNPDHCQSALDAGVQAILFGDYGWHMTIPEGIVQCSDWSAVLEYLSDGR